MVWPINFIGAAPWHRRHCLLLPPQVWMRRTSCPRTRQCRRPWRTPLHWQLVMHCFAQPTAVNLDAWRRFLITSSNDAGASEMRTRASPFPFAARVSGVELKDGIFLECHRNVVSVLCSIDLCLRRRASPKEIPSCHNGTALVQPQTFGLPPCWFVLSKLEVCARQYNAVLSTSS